MNLLMPFPEPTERMTSVYRQLAILEHGGPEADGLLDGEVIPQPWDITTIVDPALRFDVWLWLDAVVVWLNSQHGWTQDKHIPACWPKHPNLIHEISTLADQRRIAGEAASSTPLEDWHRYGLHSFLDRTREDRLGCLDKHTTWPGGPNFTRHQSDETIQRRRDLFTADCQRPALAQGDNEPRTLRVVR